MERGNRLKILRILNGYTQAEFSNRSKIPQPSIANWEKGKYGPGGEVGVKVASLLGVHPQYLFLGSPPIKSEQVWIPAVPPRDQHLANAQEDIATLFPEFLLENSFPATTIAQLRDGLAILLGQESTDSKRKYAYNCLILADSKLASSFRTALKTAEIKGCKDDDIISMVDKSIETITVNDIYDRMLLKGMYCVCDIDGLGKELQAARKRIAEKGINKSLTLPPGLEYIFRNFIQALIPSIKSPVALGLAKFFLKKCEERGHEPNAKIADTLIVEFRQELDRIASLPLSSWPDPKNTEYLLLREWLREKLADESTTQEQRLVFLEKITKDTDFAAWKEKYEKEKLLPVWF